MFYSKLNNKFERKKVNKELEQNLIDDGFIKDNDSGEYVLFYSDGCPNNCNYCEKMQLACVYNTEEPITWVNKN